MSGKNKQEIAAFPIATGIGWYFGDRGVGKSRRDDRLQAGVKRSATPAWCSVGNVAPKGRQIKDKNIQYQAIHLACRPFGASLLSCTLAGVSLRFTPACGLSSLRDFPSPLISKYHPMPMAMGNAAIKP